MTLLEPLVEELRAVGIEVSVGEHLDAVRAAAHVPLRRRAVLRAALQCALVKEAGQLATFDLLFDLWLDGADPGASGPDTGDPDAAGPGRAPLAGLTDADLRAALHDALAAGDRFLQSLLAQEYVRRFAGLEPGRPVAGVRYLLAVTQAADLDGLRDDLLGPTGAGGSGGAGGGAGGGGG
ncbi:MAG TPA: hypothetical protein VGD91_28300, partial [Trebonia sp.]